MPSLLLLPTFFKSGNGSSDMQETADAPLAGGTAGVRRLTPESAFLTFTLRDLFFQPKLS